MRPDSAVIGFDRATCYAPGGAGFIFRADAPIYMRICTFVQGDEMKAVEEPNARECNCLAIRQASRHVTQFYDQLLAASGLRTTQYAILSRLQRGGPMPINGLATALVMDRTTLGRNILPLERDGLIEIGASPKDRRRREVRLTPAGAARMRAARQGWKVAQQRFDEVFGAERAAALRDLLREVTASELTPPAPP